MLARMPTGECRRDLDFPRRATLLLLAVLAVSRPTPAAAQSSGISIGWQDCRTRPGAGGTTQTFGCTNTINDFPLFPALRLASPIDSVIAMELVIDVDVATDPLPVWWHMEPGTACHSNAWVASTSTSGNCADAWQGSGVASVQGWLVGTPGNSTRHGRLLVAASVLPDAFVTLDADVGYTVCRVAIGRNASASTCDGCTTPACLVFNSVLIRRLPGSSFEEVLLVTPETASANMVVWQGGVGADCLSVPTRRTTWGSVKALYH